MVTLGQRAHRYDVWVSVRRTWTQLWLHSTLEARITLTGRNVTEVPSLHWTAGRGASVATQLRVELRLTLELLQPTGQKLISQSIKEAAGKSKSGTNMEPHRTHETFFPEELWSLPMAAWIGPVGGLLATCVSHRWSDDVSRQSPPRVRKTA